MPHVKFFLVSLVCLISFSYDILGRPLDLKGEFLYALQDSTVSQIEELFTRGASTEYVYDYEETPIIIVAALGRPDVLACLLRHGAMINAKNQLGTTALHRAAQCTDKASVGILLANPLIIPDQVDDNEETALHYAVRGNHRNVIVLLVQSRRIPRDYCNIHGVSALELARRLGCNDIVQALTADAHD